MEWEQAEAFASALEQTPHTLRRMPSSTPYCIQSTARRPWCHATTIVGAHVDLTAALARSKDYADLAEQGQEMVVHRRQRYVDHLNPPNRT